MRQQQLAPYVTEEAFEDPYLATTPTLPRLPQVRCIVRARIPTVSGAELFLHLYHNDMDTKEHLAFVFGDRIRSHSLDEVHEGETEMDRMIRGAYTGRLRPGRCSSKVELTPELPYPNGLGLAAASAVTASNGEADGASFQGLQDVSSNDGKSEQDGKICDHSEAVNGEHDDEAPLVRIHSECYTGETAWSARCDCGEQLDEAAQLMSRPSGGVIVYLRQEGRGIGLGEKLRAYNLQDLGSDTVDANIRLRHPVDGRSYGIAISILLDLGCCGERGIRLLTNNPDKLSAVEGHNGEIRVRERVPSRTLLRKEEVNGTKTRGSSSEIDKYLRTKIQRMRHIAN
ncbi:GTP cyclohydrolase II [Puttea exsequens]|nr:GTP cyclohydrolase II [Puttea exsequens]